MAQHAFEPDPDVPSVCGYRPHAGQPECGFPASNRNIHAPGALPGPRLHSVPPIRQNSAALALDARPTSIEAAKATLPERGSKRFEIVSMLSHPSTLMQGLTDDEIERATGWLHATVSSARNSLMHDEIVEPLVVEGVEITRPTKASGRQAIAWVLTSAGLAAYQAEKSEVAS
jgi:hypothetical protein